MNLMQGTLESATTLVDLTIETEEGEEDMVRSPLVLGSPLLRPVVWSLGSNLSTLLFCPQSGTLQNIDPPSSVEEVLAMLGLVELAKEWIEVEKDLSGCETGLHTLTGPE